ncbi:MAG: TM2 domain-containing protein [Candidatus Omnitrophica bacterium]|nr:TM2 domain-containing protein [Candidatus Omnitrophota bacterium]
MAEVSERKRLAALLLCFFLGPFGAHRFYVGKIGSGILIIVTIGGFCGVWPLIDLIMIACGEFKDKEGRHIKTWT